MHHTILSRHLFCSLAENIVYIENAVCVCLLWSMLMEKNRFLQGAALQRYTALKSGL